MLIIRFLRVGKKNQPAFKIVVIDKRMPPRSGKFVEQVGFYNPTTKEKVLKKDRINYWISVGAKPSNTLYNLLVEEKILKGKKIPVHKKPKEKKKPEEVGSAEEAKTEEKPPGDKGKQEGKPAGEKKSEKKMPEKTENIEPEKKEATEKTERAKPPKEEKPEKENPET